MESQEDAIKNKNWYDLKTAVGTMAARGKDRKDNMSLDDLLLNIKAVSFDTLISQTEIQSAQDKEYYMSKGYEIDLTLEEFKEKFDVDPSCIWYTPSIAQNCIYFNESTLAAAPFQMRLLNAGLYSDTGMFYRAIQSREAEVAEQNYWGSILTLPDAMRMEYFNLLVGRKGRNIPDLYELFFSFYIDNDYGFGAIEPATLNAILNAKTQADQEKTQAKLRDLPDVIKIYRGEGAKSTPCGYSWSLDINVANFFACRRGFEEGRIVEAEVAKEDIIEAFLDDRGEEEIVVAPEHVRILDKIPIRGVDFIKPILPEVAPVYHKYRERMETLIFAQNSAAHGRAHEARVMLLSLTIAHALGLPMRDKKALAAAAIYHDTQRNHDDVDESHGKASREYYHSSCSEPDPLVEFLIEYHCLPDEEGHKEIMNNRKLSKDRSRAQLLFNIFKDADALDRVRFGLRDLDMNQLRLPISKQLSLVARVCVEQVKVSVAPDRSKPPVSERIRSAGVRASARGDKAKPTGPER